MSEFINREATFRVKVHEITTKRGIVISDEEAGVTIQYNYRNRGVRIEFIPRADIVGAYIEGKVDQKPARALPKTESVISRVEPITDPADSSEFEDEPDLDEDWEDN